MVYLITSNVFFGRLAQLVRAPALQAGGHRFESYIAHHYFFAEMAQLVAQLTCGIEYLILLNYLAPLIEKSLEWTSLIRGNLHKR